MPGNFFELDDIAVNIEVVLTRFECELSECKGACCTMESDFGAPVDEEEIDIIERILPIVKNYIPLEHYKEIEKKGFWYKKQDQLMICSIKKRECVFSYYEGDVAKCGIEKAYREGAIDFIKPISCHLFPIRIGKFGGDVLRFEEYSECEAALKKGEKNDMKVVNFCKDALERKYGKEWYAKLMELIKG